MNLRVPSFSRRTAADIPAPRLGEPEFEYAGSVLTEPTIPGTERELESGRAGGGVELWAKRVTGKDLMTFSRQLAAFVRAGIPILDGLELLERDTVNPTLRRTIAAMGESLAAGESLSGALDQHPKVFPIAFRSMLRSAELTGNLDTVLDRIAGYIERDVEARGKLRSASIYPALVALMSVGVTVLLTAFVLPKFKTFFKSFHKQLPLPTRMLMGAANITGHWWWLILTVVAVIAGCGFAWFRSARGRASVDALLLRTPVLGETLRFAMVERFCRILASMMQAGVSLPEAMDVAAQAMNNVHVRRALDAARDSMLRGEGIAASLARSRFLPPAARQMLRVGEDTGSLDTQLESAAVFYEREVDYKIKKLTSLFEPAVLVFMGLIVGFVAIALISAMYGVFRQSKVG